MYDIHCHILWGIDDGAKDIDDSIEMCKSSSERGIKRIIATPHFIEGESEVEPSALMSQVYLLNQEIKSQKIDIEILPGMEIFITPNIIELYEKGKIITLNCKNYMLLELPLHGPLPNFLEDVIFHLQIKGIKPVIAHPERCRAIMKRPDIIYNLIERGCIIQINSGSLKGLYGMGPRKTAMKLLKHSMVHVIASDRHSSRRKALQFDKCYKVIKRKFGETMAEDLLKNNPLKIINGKNIDIFEPKEIKKRNGPWAAPYGRQFFYNV